MEPIFKKLNKLIKSHDKIIIMTHFDPDLDGFGSSLALSKIIDSYNKENYIYFDKTKPNKIIDKALLKLEKVGINSNFITKKQFKQMNLDNTLLIILDTHKESILYDTKVLEYIKDVVVIDHHIKSKDNIKDTCLTYINSSSSSTVEIIINYIQYMKKEIEPMIATIMLAGIEIDTNGFNLKTSHKTYEAAAYLIRIGADNIEKQELLKQDKEDYIKQQDFVKNSYMINETTAMCTLDSNVYLSKDLAAIAEQLLQFEDVESSFVIGYIDKNKIGVSARSIGNVNVEKIMKKLNGGGHTTNAAAQIESKTIREVRDMIINIVKR